MKLIPRLAVWISVGFLPLLPSAIANQMATAENSAKIASQSPHWQELACTACHEDLVAGFAGTRHGRAVEFGAWRAVSCDSCHGDSAQHAETADPEKIANPAKQRLAEVTQTCLSCHANSGHQQQWSGSAHDSSNVSCLDCHSVHHSKSKEKLLVKVTDTQLCLSCHVEVKKAQYQRSTHLIRNEWGKPRMGCISCHEPHGSTTEKLLRKASLNETCYTCHTEKRGPFLWEHPPARENCMSCHQPHGSNNPGLLAQRSTFLCQSCHLQGRHQTVAGRPNSTWLVNRGCLNCHPQIHGSNHPSGILYHR